MLYRTANPADREPITALHIKGSQTAYATILPPHYLSVILPQEKEALWSQRLENGLDPRKLAVTVAEAEGALAGFACFILDEQTEFGTYLHNIYVSEEHQRQGVASGLLAASVSTFDLTRSQRPVHLLAFAQNLPARAFYNRLEGIIVEELQRARSDGTQVDLVRYQWSSATMLRSNALWISSRSNDRI